MSDLNERVCRKMEIGGYYQLDHKGKIVKTEYHNLLTDERVGKLLAMLAARGVAVELEYDPSSATGWACRLNLINDYQLGGGPGEAICRAIDAMPEGL